MACTLTSGQDDVCKYGAAGNNRIWLGNWEDVEAATTYTLETTPGPDFNSLKNLVLTAPAVFYEFKFLTGTCSFVTELQNKGAAGSPFWLHTVSFSSAGLSQEIYNRVDELGLARVVIIIQSRLRDIGATENKYFVAGLENGLEATTLTTGTGAASTDLAGYTPTFVGEAITSGTQIIADTAIYTSTRPNTELVDSLV